MEITRVKIDKITPNSSIKGTATIVLDNEISIHELHIIDGKDGLFIGFPNTGDVVYKDNIKRFKDIVHPNNEELRLKIQDAVLIEYNKALTNV